MSLEAVRVLSALILSLLIPTVSTLAQTPVKTPAEAPVAEAPVKAGAPQIKNRNSQARPIISSPGELRAVEQNSGGGYLGVYLGDVNDERARELSLSDLVGVVVGKIEDNSPAARAGLRVNDVIVKFNDQTVGNRAQIYRMLLTSAPGGKVTLGIVRNGEKLDIPVELGQRRSRVADEQERLNAEVNRLLASAEESRKAAVAFQQKGDEKKARELFDEEKMLRDQAEDRRAYAERQIRNAVTSESIGSRPANYSVNANRYFLGLTVIQVSGQLGKYFNLANGGVLVSEVRAGGAAERAGVKAGDCVIAVNEEKINAPAEFNRAIDKLGNEGGEKEKKVTELVLTVIRDRAEQKIPVKIETQ